eukprot:GHVR01114812.1.p1 GENE.GHVR01114812.1~~GHVR01114812.1.p1  ORF type:complete len:364 (-),score=81.63 GHVR01114812.1:145-1236(-)
MNMNPDIIGVHVESPDISVLPYKYFPYGHLNPSFDQINTFFPPYRPPLASHVLKPAWDGSPWSFAPPPLRVFPHPLGTFSLCSYYQHPASQFPVERKSPDVQKASNKNKSGKIKSKAAPSVKLPRRRVASATLALIHSNACEDEALADYYCEVLDTAHPRQVRTAKNIICTGGNDVNISDLNNTEEKEVKSIPMGDVSGNESESVDEEEEGGGCCGGSQMEADTPNNTPDIPAECTKDDPPPPKPSTRTGGDNGDGPRRSRRLPAVQRPGVCVNGDTRSTHPHIRLRHRHGTRESKYLNTLEQDEDEESSKHTRLPSTPPSISPSPQPDASSSSDKQNYAHTQSKLSEKNLKHHWRHHKFPQR